MCLSYLDCQETVCDKEFPVPKKYQTTVKMPSGLDSCDALHYHLRRTFDQMADALNILPVEPLLVLDMRIYQAIESLSPFHRSGVVMRMRDDYSLQPAERSDLNTSD